MIDLLQAVILGVVEGITEFLPISSTGHLILTTKLLGIAQTEFAKTFEIAIQLGAILSVVVLYWRRLFVDKDVFKKVAVAFLPTAILGFILYKLIKKFLLGNSQVVLWSLFLGGVFLIIFELIHKENKDGNDDLGAISYKQSILIGIFQSIAMIPGVSRSAATIIGGLSLGLKRKVVVEFSFLLAVPTMLAATALDMAKNFHTFSSAKLDSLIVGFVVSFIAALIGIKFLIAFIRSHSFIPFGIYRIILVAVFWLFGVT